MRGIRPWAQSLYCGQLYRDAGDAILTDAQKAELREITNALYDLSERLDIMAEEIGNQVILEASTQIDEAITTLGALDYEEDPEPMPKVAAKHTSDEVVDIDDDELPF